MFDLSVSKIHVANFRTTLYLNAFYAVYLTTKAVSETPVIHHVMDFIFLFNLISRLALWIV